MLDHLASYPPVSSENRRRGRVLPVLQSYGRFIKVRHRYRIGRQSCHHFSSQVGMRSVIADPSKKALSQTIEASLKVDDRLFAPLESLSLNASHHRLLQEKQQRGAIGFQQLTKGFRDHDDSCSIDCGSLLKQAPLRRGNKCPIFDTITNTKKSALIYERIDRFIFCNLFLFLLIFVRLAHVILHFLNIKVMLELRK